jgi:hypothetical protein
MGTVVVVVGLVCVPPEGAFGDDATWCGDVDAPQAEIAAVPARRRIAMASGALQQLCCSER